MSMFRLYYLNRQRSTITNAIIYGKLEEFLHSWHCYSKRLLSIGLRTVPTFVAAHHSAHLEILGFHIGGAY